MLLCLDHFLFIFVPKQNIIFFMKIFVLMESSGLIDIPIKDIPVLRLVTAIV